MQTRMALSRTNASSKVADVAKLLRLNENARYHRYSHVEYGSTVTQCEP